MKRIDPCPFCNIVPSTYFRIYGTVVGYPALELFIQCEKCEITMSDEVPYRTDKDEPDYGRTPFPYVEAAMDNLIDRWNKRINPIVEFDEKPVICPHCGYAHPNFTVIAKGSPNPFTFRISCPACGYTGELTKKDVEV